MESNNQHSITTEGEIDTSSKATVRIVDLFSGCGGLSLGFDLHDGSVHYETVMALDNWSPAVRCYNANVMHRDGEYATGRIADLTWFSHHSEVLLYYLFHYAFWKPDKILQEKLEYIGLSSFLESIQNADIRFEEDFAALAQQHVYKESLQMADNQVFNMQICKSFLIKIGVSSLRSGTIASATLPWHSECKDISNKLKLHGNGRKHIHVEPIAEIEEDLLSQWDSQILDLEEASGKTGKGQHRVVAERLAGLVSFLKGTGGQSLKNLWVRWHCERNSARATFCLTNLNQLEELYNDDRRVHLILGGPPCKGFSRIGRAVIDSLRKQGVHAWTSHEYGDERNALLHRYVLFLRALRPDAFLFENVAHFSSTLKTPSGQLEASTLLEESIANLSSNEVEYEVASAIVKARQHAIPQDRERFIMIGFNRVTTTTGIASQFFKLRYYHNEVPLSVALQGLEHPGEFAHGAIEGIKTNHLVDAYTLNDVNMPDAHQHYVNWIRQNNPVSGSKPTQTDAHVVRRARLDDMALIRKFAPGQRWMDYKLRNSQTVSELRNAIESVIGFLESNPTSNFISVEHLQTLLLKVDGGLLLRLILEEASATLQNGEEHHLLSNMYLEKGHDKHGDWFERLSAEKPCKTIVAHIGKDTYGYIHPYANRALSIREAARIQSFPDFFQFGHSGVVDAYAMIGNAVPPLLSDVFAQRFNQLHRSFGIFEGKHRNRIDDSPIAIKNVSPMSRKTNKNEQLLLLTD